MHTRTCHWVLAYNYINCWNCCLLAAYFLGALKLVATAYAKLLEICSVRLCKIICHIYSLCTVKTLHVVYWVSSAIWKRNGWRYEGHGSRWVADLARGQSYCSACRETPPMMRIGMHRGNPAPDHNVPVIETCVRSRGEWNMNIILMLPSSVAHVILWL